MKIPVEILAVLLAAVIGLQGWTLEKIISLQTDVAVLKSAAHNTLASK